MLQIPDRYTVPVKGAKGVFNHSNQLSNFSKNWGMQRSKTEIHKFHRPTLSHFSYSRSKIAIIPTMLTGKHVKFLEISLEAVIGGNKYGYVADFGLKKWKMTQDLLETLNPLSSF
mgnify:CR=1 FL=1